MFKNQLKTMSITITDESTMGLIVLKLHPSAKMY